MTPEDLDQIRGIVREETANQIAAAERRMIDRQERSTEALKLSLIDRQERSMEALTQNMSELRSELSRRMETLERRFELQTPVILSLDARMAAFTRAVDQVLATHDSDAATQYAQQRAIDDLAARVAKLEGERR